MTEPPVILAAFCEPVCEHGHVLKYGARKDAALIPRRSLSGSLPCNCAGAREAGMRRHVTVQCEACLADGRETVFYDPPHVPG